MSTSGHVPRTSISLGTRSTKPQRVALSAPGATPLRFSWCLKAWEKESVEFVLRGEFCSFARSSEASAKRCCPSVGVSSKPRFQIMSDSPSGRSLNPTLPRSRFMGSNRRQKPICLLAEPLVSDRVAVQHKTYYAQRPKLRRAVFPLYRPGGSLVSDQCSIPRVGFIVTNKPKGCGKQIAGQRRPQP
jgi:hypothetical protein